MSRIADTGHRFRRQRKVMRSPPRLPHSNSPERFYMVLKKFAPPLCPQINRGERGTKKSPAESCPLNLEPQSLDTESISFVDELNHD
jgi:hypothetical protein